MSNSKKTAKKHISDELKIKHAIDFIEEFSWLLASKSKLDLSEIPDLLRRNILETSMDIHSTNKYVSPNPNIHYLIGVLPRLFQDEQIFLKNEDIVSFAKEVLKIDIPRADKRSRYELIGLIVCRSNDLNDKELEYLVDALAEITNNKSKFSEIINAKNTVGFSWNETIRKLAEH